MAETQSNCVAVTVLPHNCVNSALLRDKPGLSCCPRSLTPVHYMDVTMLTGLIKQGAASTLGLPTCRRWVISPGKVQGLATPVQCLYSGLEHVGMSPVKVRDKFLYLKLPNTKKNSQ